MARAVSRAGAPVRRAASGTAGRDSAPELKILVLSGPNLHRLGRREPEIYGSTTLAEIHEQLAELARRRGAGVDCRQSNHEGDLIEWIGSAEDDGFAAILINPGAYTHTSYALYDAVKGSRLPTVELHLSNPDAREEFRRRSRIAPAVWGRIAGFGAASYTLALSAALDRLGEPAPAALKAAARAKSRRVFAALRRRSH